MTVPSAAPSQSAGLSATVKLVIVAACLISLIGFGVRSGFGLFQTDLIAARGWGREEFSIALAVQNLLWGVALPFAGMLADRFGSRVVLVVGALIYAVGVYGMATVETRSLFYIAGGVITGVGVAFTAFTLAMAAMAKLVPPERRSLIFGIGTAAGSAGQVVFAPLSVAFIDAFGWVDAMMIMTGFALLILPLALLLPSNPSATTTDESVSLSMGDAIQEALSHRGYILLTIGFFVCGFHVAFITVHFPAYVEDLGLAASVGATALALVGLLNIAGAFLSGLIGEKWSKRYGLSAIYFARAIAITLLLIAPKTEFTIYAFAAAMGILWLSTVPLTTGIVAQVFGIRYMATLFGFVFLSHQLGSFLGVWLGGYLYDQYGSYDAVWWAGVALGFLAAVIHLPIDERPIERTTAAAPAE